MSPAQATSQLVPVAQVMVCATGQFAVAADVHAPAAHLVVVRVDCVVLVLHAVAQTVPSAMLQLLAPLQLAAVQLLAVHVLCGSLPDGTAMQVPWLALPGGAHIWQPPHAAAVDVQHTPSVQ